MSTRTASHPPQPHTPGVPEETPTIAIADMRTIYSGGIFILAMLTALYFAKEIAMPVVLAFVLKLMLQPVIRNLQKFGLPRTVMAVLILAVLGSVIVGLASALSGPAAIWLEKLPDSVPKLQQRLVFLNHPLAEVRRLVTHADDLSLTKGVGPRVVPVVMQGNGLTDRILAATRAFAAGLFTTLMILFFLIVSGDTFLRRLVEVLPRFQDKRRAVDISQQIEQDISVYLFTITIINAAVGMSVALVSWMTGLGDPELWGTLAFLLNYIPIIGPLTGVGTVLLAGLMADIDSYALLPAAFYMLAHLLEGSLVTPWMLARRFTLNPVLVVLSLVFWYWMWGVPGAILSMPMLAITKIVCDRVQPLMAFGHFLEG